MLNKEALEDMPRKNISKWRMVMFTFQGRGIGVTHPGKPPSNSFQPTAKPSNCYNRYTATIKCIFKMVKSFRRISVREMSMMGHSLSEEILAVELSFSFSESDHWLCLSLTH